MKWSLFNWKKPVVSSGEPEDYQVVKNTVNQNSTNIRNLNNQVNTAQGTADRNEQSINNINTQLTNTVSTNTAQTITGQKTINAQTTISANPTPLILKANNNDKTYLVFRDSANNSNLSIGANASNTSFEINRGDLTIQTQQTNKTVAFETGTIKTNRARLEFGTEINAGYGGGTVKFIPEDNSTKTLQFFNANANDNRRFKLAVPEPVDNNNPATKNYVDTKETTINNQITAINNRIVENNMIQKRIYTFTPSSSRPSELGGVIYRYNLSIENFPNVSVLGVSPDFKTNSNGSALASYWEFSYALGNNSATGNRYLCIQLTGNKALYDSSAQIGLDLNIDFTKFEITVFYMENTNREAEQRYEGRIVPLNEIFGGTNEN